MPWKCWLPPRDQLAIGMGNGIGKAFCHSRSDLEALLAGVGLVVDDDEELELALGYGDGAGGSHGWRGGEEAGRGSGVVDEGEAAAEGEARCHSEVLTAWEG